MNNKILWSDLGLRYLARCERIGVHFTQNKKCALLLFRGERSYAIYGKPVLESISALAGLSISTRTSQKHLISIQFVLHMPFVDNIASAANLHFASVCINI